VVRLGDQRGQDRAEELAREVNAGAPHLLEEGQELPVTLLLRVIVELTSLTRSGTIDAVHDRSPAIASARLPRANPR